MDDRMEVEEAAGSISIRDAEELRRISDEFDGAIGRSVSALRAGLVAENATCDRPRDEAERVRTMIDLCSNIVDITRAFRDYVTLLPGGPTPRWQAIGVAELIELLDARHRSEAERVGLSWSCTLEGPDACVTTDPERWEEALGHLVSNAFRFTPSGGEVGVRAQIDGNSNRWHVEVRDTGVGIPDVILPRVFDPFVSHQPHDAGCAVQSPGLGLSVCRLLVEQLGGTVTIAKGPAGGTIARAQWPIEMALATGAGRGLAP